jgi:hypothetical protein
MGDTPQSKEERRAALIKLQKLLAQAEARLGDDGSQIDPIFDELGNAFDDFRVKYHDRTDLQTEPNPGAEARRLASRRLASAIEQMDESVSLRDSQRLRAALDDAKQALDTCQRIDQSTSSGLRVRRPEEEVEGALPKQGKRS